MNILMTGGASSVGQTISDRLRAQGHRLYTVGYHEDHDYVINFAYSSMVEKSAPDLFEKAESATGGCIDVLINHAGMTHMAWMEDHSLASLEDVMNVNFTTPFILCREYLKRIMMYAEYREPLQPGRYYRIVNTISMGTVMGLRTSPAYTCSKAALEMLTRNMAKEFAGRWPIMVCGISPGGIEHTGMEKQAWEALQRDRGMNLEQAKKYFAGSPLGRSCQHEEVWSLYDFAVNRMPMQCTGTLLKMTGGFGY